MDLTFPEVSNDVFLLSENQTDDIVGSATATNSTLSSAMSGFIDSYENTLVTSRILYRESRSGARSRKVRADVRPGSPVVYLGIALLVLISGIVGYLSGGNVESEASSSPSRPPTSTKASYRSLSKRGSTRGSQWPAVDAWDSEASQEKVLYDLFLPSVEDWTEGREETGKERPRRPRRDLGGRSKSEFPFMLGRFPVFLTRLLEQDNHVVDEDGIALLSDAKGEGRCEEVCLRALPGLRCTGHCSSGVH